MDKKLLLAVTHERIDKAIKTLFCNGIIDKDESDRLQRKLTKWSNTNKVAHISSTK